MGTVHQIAKLKPDYELVEFEGTDSVEMCGTTVVQHQKMTPELREKFLQAYEEHCNENGSDSD